MSPYKWYELYYVIFSFLLYYRRFKRIYLKEFYVI